MVDHDDLEDVELNYLRDQALSSRQQPVPSYSSYSSLHPSANSEVNLDLDIFNPSLGPNRTVEHPRPRRTHRQTTPDITAEIMKSFDKKVSSSARSGAVTAAHRRARDRSSSSSSRSSSTSSYSSYSRHSYSSQSRSRSSSRSLSPSTKSTTSRSTYSSVSNHSHVRRRSRSPIRTYHRHHPSSHRRSSISPHRERPRQERLSNPRRRHHSDVRTGRLVGDPVRYSEYSRRSPPSHTISRSRIRSPIHGFKAPPPPRRSLPHRRSSPPRRSPPRRSPPPMSRRTPPIASHRSPPRRLPPSHRSPMSYRDSRVREREPPPRLLPPPPRSPHRRRHSMSPPRPPVRHRRSMSPPPMMRRHSPPPPPPPRRIRMTPPPKPLPPPSSRHRPREEERRRVVVRDRDQWEGSSRLRESRYPPRDHPRGPRSDRDSRMSRRLEQKESLEQWRKRKREENARNEAETPKKKISRRVSSSELDSKPSKVRERPSSGADGEDVDDRLKMASPYEEESGFGGGGGSLGEAGLEGVDVLDEELDYDETMEDIEQLYLREDDDTSVLKSEVVPRHSPHSSSECSPLPRELESISCDENEAYSNVRAGTQQDSLTDNANTIVENTGVDDVAEDNLKEIDEPEALEEEEEGGKEVDTSAIVEKQGEEDDVENENEEGLLKEEEEEGVEEAAAEEDKELSTEEGEVLPQSSNEEDQRDEEHVSDEDLGMKPTQPISSPIRLTPERGENRSGRSRHRPSQQPGRGGGEPRRRDEDKPRLPVRDRLYVSKSYIERKKQSLNYQQHHKLSPNLASRLGPPSGRQRNSGQRRATSDGRRDRPTSSKRDAIAIAEAYRRQKRKNDFKRDDPEFQRERRRISKLLLNDHYDTEKGSSHRNPKNDDVDLDQKINKIRREDQRRLMRQEEVRKDRQRYG